MQTRTEASDYLVELAKRCAEPYIALPAIRAILLTGSAAEGVSDFYSDIDMILYYDALPSEEALAEAAARNGGTDRKPIAPREEAQFIEHYYVNGVECQCAHATVAQWESDMASVLEALDVASVIQKALGGLEDAIPLHGGDLIARWQRQLDDYPAALREAMVRHYLAFPAVWALHDRLETRDGTIWRTEMMVGVAYNLLGTLAGLNRRYFSPFQFKRMHRFAEKLAIAPPDFADRLETAFHAEPGAAALTLEMLVKETVELVERHMPEIDTAQARRRIGWRPQAWTIPTAR